MTSPTSSNPSQSPNSLQNITVKSDSKIFKREVSAEDIAKCRGQSQSFFARAVNNLKLLAEGKVVTDKHVEALLNMETKTKLEPLFKDALNNHSSESTPEAHHTAKVIKNDLKMTADLSTLLANVSKNKSSEDVGDAHANYRNNSLILNYKVALEKYEPLDLLKAAEFEKQGIELPAEKNSKKDTKALFVDFLAKRNPTPQTPADLKKAYKEFVDMQVTKFKANPEKMPAELKAAQKDESLKLHMQFIAMGAAPALAVEKKDVREMQIIKDVQAAREKKFVEEMKKDLEAFKSEKDIYKRGELLKDMYHKEFDGVSVFKNACEKMYTDESVTFIIDVIDMKKSQGIGDEAIKAKYIDQDSPKQVNLTSSVSRDVLSKFAAGQNDMQVFDKAYSEIMLMFDRETLWHRVEPHIDLKPIEKKEEVGKDAKAAQLAIEGAEQLDVQPKTINKPQSKMLDLNSLSDEGSNPFG